MPDSAKKRPSTGRAGGLEEARELVALISSLEGEGDFVSAEAIQARLGCTPERARKLLDLLLQASAGDDYLPLSSAHEEGPAVEMGDAEATSLRGRRLRLTPMETTALLSALRMIGVGGDDPLRRALEGGALADTSNESLVDRVVDASASPATANTIQVCSEAIARGSALSFLYRKADGSESAREVEPRSLSQQDGTWYLRAADSDGGEKSFRLDRMTRPEPVERGRKTLLKAQAQTEESNKPQVREITVFFDDPTVLDLFEWPGLELAEDGRAGTLPYYGGPWLPRQLAACAGAARTDDPRLRALISDYARQQLSAN